MAITSLCEVAHSFTGKLTRTDPVRYDVIQVDSQISEVFVSLVEIDSVNYHSKCLTRSGLLYRTRAPQRAATRHHQTHEK